MQAKAEPGDGQHIRRLEPNGEVVGQKLGDEVVLVNLTTNRIFELNHTAGRFWNLLQEENDRGRIEEQLLAEFDVPENELKDEVNTLISRLAAEDLVRVLERD
jgi:Coenzyme PQQ synthesis protein D (PqqD)